MFIIHGKEDEEIHYSHGVMIYEKLKAAAEYTPWYVRSRLLFDNLKINAV